MNKKDFEQTWDCLNDRCFLCQKEIKFCSVKKDSFHPLYQRITRDYLSHLKDKHGIEPRDYLEGIKRNSYDAPIKGDMRRKDISME